MAQAYLGTIAAYHEWVHPKSPVPCQVPSFGLVAGEVLFGIFAYDALFAPLHYFMHRCPPLRGIHAFHHRRESHHALVPVEVVQHSYVDASLQVAVNILVQNISPFGGLGQKHALSRILHNIIVTFVAPSPRPALRC